MDGYFVNTDGKCSKNAVVQSNDDQVVSDTFRPSCPEQGDCEDSKVVTANNNIIGEKKNEPPK